MYAPQTESIGASGESFVMAEFQELGWGSVRNPDHDLGTDLLLMARRPDRFDLGILVGAQVKNGESYFSSVELDTESGHQIGWWYAERDNKHFDYWRNHSLPHLLILRNPQTRTSYWVHITGDVIKSTGKGSRILVPASQTVSESSRDALTAVATSPAKSGGFDGSAWNVGNPVRETDRLRYACIAPRLVAPHANLGGVIPDAVEAVAMLMQGRFTDLLDLSTHDKRASDERIAGLGSWEWDLFDALWLWVVEGDLAKLEDLDDGDRGLERATLAALRATAYAELARPKEGLSAVEDAEANEGFSSVDAEWLRTHKARCLTQLGRLDEAHRCALEVQRLRAIAPHDPTATALVASSTALIFDVISFGGGDIAELIQSIDTTTRWWRATTIATGLQRQFEDAYRAWGRDKSEIWFASDTAGDSLRSASLLAGVSGDHGGWSNALSLLARRELMRAESGGADVVVSALQDLLRTGSRRDLIAAVKRIGDDGPVEPLIQVCRELELETTPRSCLNAALGLLLHAGDFAQTAEADRHADWLIRALEDPDTVRSRLKPVFLLENALLEALQGLMASVSPEVMCRIRDHLIALMTIEDQGMANGYRHILSRVSHDLWSEEDLSQLSKRRGDNWELQEDIDSVLASHREEFRESLLARIRRGDLAALASFGDVRDLPEEAVRGAIEVLSRRIAQQLQAARNGTYRFGGHDLGRTLVILNAWHAGSADWRTVLDLLSERWAHSNHISGAIRSISGHAERIPGPVAAELKTALAGVAERSPDLTQQGLWSHHDDFRSLAKLAVSRLSPEEVSDTVVRALLRGRSEDRQALGGILSDRRSPGDMSLLLVLSGDDDVATRVEAIVGMTRWALDDETQMELRDQARLLIEGGGPRVARAVSSYVAVQPVSDLRTFILEDLRGHASALVRNRVSRALADG